MLSLISHQLPEYMLLWLSNCEWDQLDGREEGSCLGGGNSCGIYLWWILWISMYETRRSSSLRYKDLALGWGGFVIFVESINL